MIRVKKGNDPVVVFIYEIFRRIYSESINEHGEFGDFDIICKLCGRNSRGQLDIPFDDYYCPDYRQNEIMNETMNEGYIIEGYKYKHKLKELQKQRIRTSVSLGCSPTSNIKFFLKLHPGASDAVKNEQLDIITKELE